MKENTKKAMLLRSEYNEPDEWGGRGEFGEEQDKKLGIISHKARYTGSDFHMTVQFFLAQNIDLRTHFKDRHRSRYNQ